MSIVAGVDFGTLSVRVSIFDSRTGCLGLGAGEYPLHRKKEDPDFATESPDDQMRGFVEACGKAFDAAGVRGEQIEAVAAAATGSTIVPVGEGLAPLDDYYMWCDHRAWREAARLTEVARQMNVEAIRWCGGAYPAEGGFAKLLHWLRHNPDQQHKLVTVLEHADMFPATMCGIRDVGRLPRSIGVAGPKWMWNEAIGGLPPQDYLTAVDPLLEGVREKLRGRYQKSNEIAGRLTPEWANRTGLREATPVSVGGLDGYWDALGAGIREGDVVTVLGSSAPIMALARNTSPIPGTCGATFGSIHPDMYAIEAGLTASGDIWNAIARRAGSSVTALSRGLEAYRAGQTGLLRLTWDNGDRSVLVNSELGGVTLGWKLTTTAQDELFAAFEGTAFHTRVILERFEEHGVPVRQLILGGRTPRKNEVISRVYANVLGKPVLVPRGETTGLGAAIFAFLGARTFRTVEEAQHALCPGYRTVGPDPEAARIYDQLFALYKKLYFGLGHASAALTAGDILPALRGVAAGSMNR
jgi:L-ribulokinase